MKRLRRSLPTRLRPDPVYVLGLILIVAAGCRAFRLSSPGGVLIFDETYYVNAARAILGWHIPSDNPYVGSPAGLDPNHEHPPLGKLLIAGSMRLFGDNAFGWRLPSLVAGVASILLVYAIVRAAKGDAWLGVLAAGIFAFDNLALVQGRIATLDMPFVAVLLLGAWFWLEGWPLAAGVACAVAALIKLPAVYGAGALLLLSLGAVVRDRLTERIWNRRALTAGLILVVSFAATGLLGLWLLDLAVSTYNTPWGHLRFMLKYGFAISHSGGPVNSESNPWQWLANEVQIQYLRVTEDVKVGGHVVGSRPLYDFRGAMNPVVIGAASLGVAYAAWRAWRFRDRLSLWVGAWVTATYFSFYPLVLFEDRTTYLFYFLPTLPAVAVAIAQLLRQSGLPRAVTWGYVVVLLVGFWEYFPIRRLW